MIQADRRMAFKQEIQLDIWSDHRHEPMDKDRKIHHLLPIFLQARIRILASHDHS